MGTHVRLLASDPAPLPEARAEIERLAARLTRFDARSELCALNADPRAVVPASRGPAGCGHGRARRRERTGGLADPTLLGALERAGYDRTLTGRPRTLAAGGPGGGSGAAPRAGPSRRARGAR